MESGLFSCSAFLHVFSDVRGAESHHAGWSLSEVALFSVGHDCRPPVGREETSLGTLAPVG